LGPELRLGHVVDYDERRGLGTVAADPVPGAGDPGPFRFHCTAIADGSRSIEPGLAVAFSVVASHGGGREAVAVTKLPAAAAPS
jgi:cold shock CspA family protein